MFAVSRFAHYLKAMMRDKLGSFMSRAQCEAFLNEWITNYVLLDDTASQDQKAKFPLASARIDVTEIAGKPGAYNAIAYLRPHFQLEELNVSLRLVAKLPVKK
jgi:type VI secretion system protein ImpC